MAGGDITVSGLTAANSANVLGTTTLDSVANIEFITTASEFSAPLTIEADASVTVSANLTADGALGSTGVDFDNTGGVITTKGQDILIDHTGQITAGAKIDSGNNNNILGGNITLDADSGLIVDAILTTVGGGGGGGTVNFTSGGITLNVAPTLGQGDVNLGGGGADTTINAAISTFGSISITASRDITINQLIQTTGTTSYISIIANSDNSAGTDAGGVYISAAGQLDSGQNVTVTGSDYFGTAGTRDSIIIDADGANNQIQADGNITLNTQAATVTDEDIIVAGNIESQSIAGAIDINAADAIIIGTGVPITNLTTGGGNITFQDDVIVSGDTQVVTGAGTGDIAFNAAVDLDGNDLTLNAGFAGDITITGDVSDTSTGGNLFATNADEHSYTALTLNSLTISNAQTSVTLGGDIAAAATGDITVNTTGWIRQDGDIVSGRNVNYDSGAAIIPATTSSLLISANNPITVSGTVDIDSFGLTTIESGSKITAGGAVTFAANKSGLLTTSSGIETSSDNITFTKAVTLGADALIDTGAAGAGDITFNENVLGDFRLTVAAGTGNIDFLDTVGDTTALSGLLVTSGATLDFTDTVEIDDQGLDVTAGTVTFADDVTSTNGGSVTITNAGLLDIAPGADMNLDGLFLQDGAGSIQTAGNITTNAANLTFTQDVTLTDGATVVFSTGAATGGNIALNDTVSGTSSENLTLISGSGTTIVTGEVGAGNQIDTLTLQANNAGATGAVTFNGDVTASTLTTFARGYSVALNEDADITNDTNFLNTNGVTLGDGTDDLLTFTGGLGAVAGTISTAGTIQTTNTQMDLGATTLTADTTLRSGTAAINVASADDGLGDFDLRLGSVTQTGAITVSGNTTVDTLNTFASAYNVSLSGAANTITTDTTFANTGSVSLGQAGGTTTFTGGLDTTAALSGTNVAGIVETTNTDMDLGATTLTAAATLRSGSAAIIAASVTDGASSFALSLGDGRQSGAITVSGSTTVDTLTTFASAYDIALNGAANTVTTDTTFLNTGSVSLGQAGGSTSFTGGLATTAAVGGTNIAGIVETTNSQIDLGATTLTAASTLRSGSGAINVATATDGASSFALSLGSGSQTGAVTFTGDVTTNALNTFSSAYAITLQGASNTIDQNTSFLNTGLTALGNDATDSSTFTGGLDAVTAGGVSMAGTVATTNTQIDLGAVTLTRNATLKSGSGSINVASVTDGGGNYTLTLHEDNGSSTGAVTFAGNVTLEDLITFDEAHAVALQGAVNTIDQDTGFLNTGLTTIGNDATDSSTFAGGLDAVTAGGVSIAGTVNTTNTRMDLGAVTLTGHTTLDAGTGVNAEIDLAGGVSGGAFNLTLDAGNQVTQSAAVTVSGLELLGSAEYILTQPGNNIDTLAANVTNDISFTETNGFEIGTVNATSGLNATVNEIVLSSGGAVSQTQDITAAGLALTGAGAYTLTNGSNDIDTLAVNAGGATSFTDTDDVTIGTVGATVGVTTSNDDVTLQTGTTLDINSAVSIGAGNLVLNSGGATNQTASITAAGLALTGNGPYDLSNSANAVVTLAANTGNTISYRDSDSLLIGSISGTTGITTTNDNVSIQTGPTSHNLGINGAVSLGAANLTLTATGAVTQSAPIGASGLELLGSGAYTLNNASNDVTTLAGSTTNTISYTDVNNLIVGTVNTTGLTATAAISLAAGGGVAVTDNLSAGATNNVTLNAQGGAITGAGTIIANLLTLDAAGAITSNTTVSNLNASTTAAGAIGITETDALVLNDVDTASGAITVNAGGAITATDVASLADSDANDITITSTGAGIAAGTINAGTLGDVTLSAQAAITDAAGKITADHLLADAAGAMTLDTTVNTINASTSAAGGMQITETNDVDLTDVDTNSGPINALVGGALTATDVQAAGGSINLNASSMTLTTVSAPGNPVNLAAGGAVNAGTFTGSTGTVTSGTIGLTQQTTANVSNLFLNLSSEVSGRSGEVQSGAALLAAGRPPDGNIQSVGTVTIDPFTPYLASIVDVDISAILASLATLSSAQQQLETLLDATTASEFFMSPPLEIYIDMDEKSEFDESVEDSLDDDF